MDDEAAYAYYANPDNRVPAGPGRRRKPTLSTLIPIRFSPEVIAEARRLAHEDRRTVSSWIRNLVEDEIRRRDGDWTREL